MFKKKKNINRRALAFLIFKTEMSVCVYGNDGAMCYIVIIILFFVLK